MSKVGILSMQRIANYGSFLQAYALKQLIQKQGHEVQFVDYRVEPPIIKENADQTNPISRKIQKGMETFKYHAPFMHKIDYIKYKKNFNKKYTSILEVTDEMNYTPELDYLVIGSDEVFNCIQKNSKVGYSLELFGKDNRAKRTITYAASFGNTTMKKIAEYGKEDEIANLLNDIAEISVRDNNSGDVVEKLTTKKVEYHLDPVLAFDYIGECDLIPKLDVKEKYMILYAYSGRISDEESDWISQYAKKKGLKIYAIGGIQKCADKFIDCSPFEVLAYFQNAEEVITDTFHGSIMSIITHRKFTTLVRKSVGNEYGNEEKLTDLLERLTLTNRMTYEVCDSEKINSEDINYIDIDTIINKQREKTNHYLKEALTK